MLHEGYLIPAAKKSKLAGKTGQEIAVVAEAFGVQVGATDSEDEADTAEDLQRIEAAAAAISQRMQQTSPIAAPAEIQVSLFFG